MKPRPGDSSQSRRKVQCLNNQLPREGGQQDQSCVGRSCPDNHPHPQPRAGKATMLLFSWQGHKSPGTKGTSLGRERHHDHRGMEHPSGCPQILPRNCLGLFQRDAAPGPLPAPRSHSLPHRSGLGCCCQRCSFGTTGSCGGWRRWTNPSGIISATLEAGERGVGECGDPKWKNTG